MKRTRFASFFVFGWIGLFCIFAVEKQSPLRVDFFMSSLALLLKAGEFFFVVDMLLFRYSLGNKIVISH